MSCRITRGLFPRRLVSLSITTGLTICVSLFSFVLSAMEKSDEKIKKAFVPPGFESLLEPQTTEVDVYFGGVFLNSTLATYTPSEITFLQVDDLVGRIPGLLDAGSIEALLSQPLPTNSEFVCLKKTQSNCGQLATESVDVIFDENRFRVDIFIGQELLAIRGTGIDKYLPPSSAGLSLLNQITANYTGVGGGSNVYNIGNSTTLSYQETRLVTLSNFTRKEDFTIDTLALEREFSGRLYQAGYFRSSPGNLVFINETDFAGVTIGSSLDTRKDLDQSAGNDLQLFLETRSRVGIFKDGRLISSRIYEAGNQILDTSQLPGGAYDVVLRIRDSGGRIREETRFYVKTNDIPPMGQSLYFFDFGERVTKVAGSTLPRTTGESIMRIGMNRRIRENFGAQIGFVKQEEKMLMETGIFKLGRYYDVNLRFAAGNNNDYGFNANVRLRAGQKSLTANLRRTWTGSSTSLLGKETLQADINLTLPLGKGLLNITGRYNDQQQQLDKNLGIRYDFQTYRLGSSIIDYDIQLTKDNGNLLFLIGARLSRIHGRWRNEISSQYYYEDQKTLPKDTGLINNLNTSWNDGDKYISDMTWNLRAIDERNDNNLETDFELASDRGRLNLDASYSEKTQQVNYGASINTTFIANSHTVSLGGRTQARSALVMDVKGDVNDAFFDVAVNGSVRGSAQIGTKTVIGILPYETYEVELIPRGGSLVDFNDQIQSATLYPGNVVTMTFKATRVIVAFGQIVDANGEAIRNALIKGVIGLATTDEFGLFQAEIESSTRKLRVQTRQRACEVAVPDFPSGELVISLGELRCL